MTNNISRADNSFPGKSWVCGVTHLLIVYSWWSAQIRAMDTLPGVWRNLWKDPNWKLFYSWRVIMMVEDAVWAKMILTPPTVLASTANTNLLCMTVFSWWATAIVVPEVNSPLISFWMATSVYAWTHLVALSNMTILWVECNMWWSLGWILCSTTTFLDSRSRARAIAISWCSLWLHLLILDHPGVQCNPTPCYAGKTHFCLFYACQDFSTRIPRRVAQLQKNQDLTWQC